MKVIQDVVHIIRSTKQLYLTAKARPEGKKNETITYFVFLLGIGYFIVVYCDIVFPSIVYISCQTADVEELLKEFEVNIATLGGSQR